MKILTNFVADFELRVDAIEICFQPWEYFIEYLLTRITSNWPKELTGNKAAARVNFINKIDKAKLIRSHTNLNKLSLLRVLWLLSLPWVSWDETRYNRTIITIAACVTVFTVTAAAVGVVVAVTATAAVAVVVAAAAAAAAG